MKKLAILALVMTMSVSAMTGCGTSKVAETDLADYEVYYKFTDENKELGNQLVTKYMNEGMTSEDACGQAITEIIDKMVQDSIEFGDEYMTDTNRNGIYDSIENGKVTQEEFDRMYEEIVGVKAGSELTERQKEQIRQYELHKEMKAKQEKNK